ncbi:hypothetical protein ACFX1W_034861 [Malus domestica]
MAYQHRASNKEIKWQIESLRRLHRYPVPQIDLLVDSTSGNQLLSFLDAYSGYNQIAIHEPDKERTAFVIERSTYYYKVMPFGFKNTRATYKRLENMMSTKKIGVTTKFYVEDIMVTQ